MSVNHVFAPKEGTPNRPQLSSSVNATAFYTQISHFPCLPKEQLGKEKMLLWKVLPVNHCFKINKLIKGKELFLSHVWKLQIEKYFGGYYLANLYCIILILRESRALLRCSCLQWKWEQELSRRLRAGLSLQPVAHAKQLLQHCCAVPSVRSSKPMSKTQDKSTEIIESGKRAS